MEKNYFTITAQYINRVVTCILISFLPLTRVVYHNIGWDTLYLFAPYSFKGLPKDKFLEFYEQQKLSPLRRVEWDDYNRALKEIGSYEKSLEMKEWFSAQPLIIILFMLGVKTKRIFEL